MNHKLKLFLGIFTSSLLGLGFFGMIAYESAVSASYDRESELLKKFASHFVDDLTEGLEFEGREINPQSIVRWLDEHQGHMFGVSILIQEQEVLSAIESRSYSRYFITRLFQNNISGSRSLDGQTFTWYSVQIKNTPYFLSVTHNVGDSDTGAYFRSLGVPMIVTAALLMWLTIWATFYIGNLYEKLNDKKNALEYQSKHDALTGLMNRTIYLKNLKALVEFAQEKKHELSLCYINIGNFKDINQTLGHQYGDDLLRTVAVRCKTIVGNGGMVSRLGAAEFAVVLPDHDMSETRNVIDDILQSIEDDITIDNVKLNITTNVGIASYPEHAESLDELIHHVEIAMENAKRLGSRITIFHNDLLTNYQPNLNLISLKSVEG